MDNLSDKELEAVYRIAEGMLGLMLEKGPEGIAESITEGSLVPAPFKDIIMPFDFWTRIKTPEIMKEEDCAYLNEVFNRLESIREKAEAGNEEVLVESMQMALTYLTGILAMDVKKIPAAVMTKQLKLHWIGYELGEKRLYKSKLSIRNYVKSFAEKLALVISPQIEQITKE